MTPSFIKPSVLYHASESKTIKEFEPKNWTKRDSKEGPVVFATSDKAYASMFIVPSDDSWTLKGRYGDKSSVYAWHIIVNGRDRFTNVDKGGSIYNLPVESFSYDVNRNMADIEWTSQIPVRPKGQTNYKSGLEAMKKLGIKVYFVNDQTFNAIKKASDHGQSIISGLISD